MPSYQPELATSLNQDPTCDDTQNQNLVDGSPNVFFKSVAKYMFTYLYVQVSIVVGCCVGNHLTIAKQEQF